jgi:prophage regulatory protein
MTTNEQPRLRRVLRLSEVERATGRKHSAIYGGIAAGTFPAPIPLGPRAVGWLEDEIAEWQERQIAERNARIAERKASDATPTHRPDHGESPRAYRRDRAQPGERRPQVPSRQLANRYPLHRDRDDER